MKTYMAVKSEIAKLEKQAQALRKRELKNVITKIRSAIDEYGLTAADLGFGGGAKKTGARKKVAKRRAARSVGVARYRDPATQQTWTGRGRPPAWIASAKNRDDYLIAAAGKPAAKKKRAATAKKANKARRGRKLIKSPAVTIESGAAAA